MGAAQREGRAGQETTSRLIVPVYGTDRLPAQCRNIQPGDEAQSDDTVVAGVSPAALATMPQRFLPKGNQLRTGSSHLQEDSPTYLVSLHPFVVGEPISALTRCWLVIKYLQQPVYFSIAQPVQITQ